MKILLMGGAGFIGTNLAIKLAENQDNQITLVDRKKEYFETIERLKLPVQIQERNFSEMTNFDNLLAGQDVIYHLVSTTVPGVSNKKIAEEICANVVATSHMLDSSVRVGVKKVVFMSSGGTVYGKENRCPVKEGDSTNPISSYGLQKVTIEKLLYLYRYMYGLDYRIIRLANPYGPYQKPNGVQGVVTTFTYKVLHNEEIIVYGDGSVVRDYIYIEDAVRGILNIANGESEYRTFNLGCGYGTSINQLLKTIRKTLGCNIRVVYKEARKVDVPVNYLDISRYESVYGKLNPISLSDGIAKTVQYMSESKI